VEEREGEVPLHDPAHTHLSDKTPGGVVGRPFSRAIDAIEPERAPIPSLLVTDVVDAFFSRLGGASVPPHDPLLCLPSMFNARVDGDATYGWMPCASPVTREACVQGAPLVTQTHASVCCRGRDGTHPPAGVSRSTHGTRHKIAMCGVW
jgi:hypothetical protein